MTIGNNITSENLITVKELINNWQIASTSKKKKKNCLKNTGQLNPTRNPIDSFWLVTCLKMTHFDPWPVLTRNPINPTRPARFAMSSASAFVLFETMLFVELIWQNKLHISMLVSHLTATYASH